MKPFFSDKGFDSTGITLIENDEILSDDKAVADTFNDFFANAAKSLNLHIPSDTITEGPVFTADPIDAIILKYSNHPSIKNKKSYVGDQNFSLD